MILKDWGEFLRFLVLGNKIGTGMKVVGICGSPRLGNTEWMLRKLLEVASNTGVQTDLILLREKDIKGCDGCLSCETGGKQRKGI